MKKAMAHLDDIRCTNPAFAPVGGVIELGEGYNAKGELIDGQPNVPPRRISYNDFLAIKLPVWAVIVTVFFAWVQRLTR